MTIDYANLTADDLANMSQEDFAKLDPSKFPVEEPQAAPVAIELEQPPVEEQHEEVPPVEEPDPNTPPVEVPTEAVPNGAASEAEQTQAGTEPQGGTETKPEPTKVEQLTEQVDPAKSFYDKVTAEFQANGKQFKIDNAEDAVKLMQMGLNYNQKMATMKPGLKMLKALQDQGINSLEDLGYLFDLKAKKPEAIAKLVQESGVEAYEFNEEKAQAYQPSVPQVSDQTIAFEEVANSLGHNPHFQTVVNNLGGYDDHTKQEIFNNPNLLGLLTDHVEKGFYSQIVSRLEQEQALGRMQGMSFLQAYDTIGQQLFAQPAPTPPVQQPVPVAAPVAQPTPVPVASNSNPSNNAARQAAAGAPSIAASAAKVTYSPEDIWNMSPEEFKKLDPKFL